MGSQGLQNYMNAVQGYAGNNAAIKAYSDAQNQEFFDNWKSKVDEVKSKGEALIQTGEGIGTAYLGGKHAYAKYKKWKDGNNDGDDDNEDDDTGNPDDPEPAPGEADEGAGPAPDEPADEPVDAPVADEPVPEVEPPANMPESLRANYRAARSGESGEPEPSTGEPVGGDDGSAGAADDAPDLGAAPDPVDAVPDIVPDILPDALPEVGGGLADAALGAASTALDFLGPIGALASIGIGLYELFHPHAKPPPPKPSAQIVASKSGMVLPSYDSVVDTPASQSAF